MKLYQTFSNPQQRKKLYQSIITFLDPSLYTHVYTLTTQRYVNPPFTWKAINAWYKLNLLCLTIVAVETQYPTCGRQTKADISSLSPSVLDNCSAARFLSRSSSNCMYCISVLLRLKQIVRMPAANVKFLCGFGYPLLLTFLQYTT